MDGSVVPFRWMELNLTFTVYNENCRRKFEFDLYPSSVTPTLDYNKIEFKIFVHQNKYRKVIQKTCGCAWRRLCLLGTSVGLL
jgi:hypothetical protein